MDVERYSLTWDGDSVCTVLEMMLLEDMPQEPHWMVQGGLRERESLGDPQQDYGMSAYVPQLMSIVRVMECSLDH